MSRRYRNQDDLDCAVANVTGEDLRFIRRHGFSLVDSHNANFDPEPDLLPPQYIDWDDLELSRHDASECQPSRSIRRVA